MLSQLVYVSQRNASCTDAEIDNILEACKRNNPDLGITGVLLYSKKKFLQMVEGESKTLMTLYEKIKKDDRHSNCVMLSYGPIKEKSFPSWHMANKEIDEEKVMYQTNITATDKAQFDSLLEGKEGDGNKINSLLKKFFK